MKRIPAFLSAMLLLASLSACGTRCNTLDTSAVITSGTMGGLRTVTWEERTYIPFCVVSKNDLGDFVGYVDGDDTDIISSYKDYDTAEWLANWLPYDGGAMLMKEEHVTAIPDGLVQEYTVDDNR